MGLLVGDIECGGLDHALVITDQHPGQQLLLPLSSSVYINGALESVDKVLIDVGTGYYVEV